MRLPVIHGPGYEITDYLDAQLLPGDPLVARLALQEGMTARRS
jgi:hypothetical protein